jgi:hypothetical protein
MSASLGSMAPQAKKSSEKFGILVPKPVPSS